MFGLPVSVLLVVAVGHSVGAGATNRFGIGLVSEGDNGKLDLAKGLVGDGGWVLLTMAGVDNTTTTAPASWTAALTAAYARNLSVVVRLSPPWGSSHYRDEADDAGRPRKLFATLAGCFRATVAGLLTAVPASASLYVQFGNEPDLCYEWFCQRPASPLDSGTIAAEYAAFFSQAAAAVRTLNDPRLKLGAAPLAPGGGLACGCCGSSSCGDADKPGITGLQFMQSMMAAVPDVFTNVDFLASHSYPASGIGYGFNAPFSSASPGLHYYQLELETIKAPSTLPVLITETGWATSVPGLPACSEQDKASWTTQAYEAVWLNDTRILGVMPFMLQDPQWGDKDGYEYVKTSGDVAPVYTAVAQLRKAKGFPPL